jgi:RimJ/RimL family protein N-acetyltransferase
MATTILETPRLRLQTLTLDDAPFILELVNTPSWITHIGDRGIRTLDDARTYLQNGPLHSYRLHGFGLWLIVVRATGVPLGICGLIRRLGLDDPDLGFALMPVYEGQGYAFEVAAATLTHARTVLGLRTVLAITTATNPRSIRLLERLGMQFEDTVYLPGVEEELMLFGWEEGNQLPAQ